MTADTPSTTTTTTHSRSNSNSSNTSASWFSKSKNSSFNLSFTSRALGFHPLKKTDSIKKNKPMEASPTDESRLSGAAANSGNSSSSNISNSASSSSTNASSTRRYTIQRSDSREFVGLAQMQAAEAQFALENYKAAFALWDEAWRLRTSKLGSKNDLVAQTHFRRGVAYRNLRLHFQSVTELERAHRIRQETLQADYDDERALLTADTLLELAAAQHQLHRYEDALQSLTKALSLKENMFEDGLHLEVAHIHWLLGKHHHQRRQYDVAQRKYQEAYSIYRSLGLSKTHPLVVKVKKQSQHRGILAHSLFAEEQRRAVSV
eukprot:CAMPEP_0194043916 /NCGR_PEP_ID=MMETSP0009_2-20130614/15475_1 /TAXON_ID=210454 /ORGANISM="Grammatophora oceanica, Strain CCMP 410" /LENGTH=319 /DNA_ID=CAMNT_0038688299 /DNA_START=12 /DNA_END=971 /DNA_ORIENTATION=-